MAVAVGISRVRIVVQRVLKEDADRLLLILAHEFREHMPAANVGEAADATDDLAELVRTLPGDVEGANRATAGATYGTAFGIFRTLEDEGAFQLPLRLLTRSLTMSNAPGHFVRKVNRVVSFSGAPGLTTIEGKFVWWIASG